MCVWESRRGGQILGGCSWGQNPHSPRKATAIPLPCHLCLPKSVLALLFFSPAPPADCSWRNQGLRSDFAPWPLIKVHQTPATLFLISFVPQFFPNCLNSNSIEHSLFHLLLACLNLGWLLEVSSQVPHPLAKSLPSFEL